MKKLWIIGMAFVMLLTMVFAGGMNVLAYDDIYNDTTLEWPCIHEYDGDCDEDCNRCGAIRENVADHTFDDQTDNECNVCGYYRGTDDEFNDVEMQWPCKHEDALACDTVCPMCNEAIEPASDHIWEEGICVICFNTSPSSATITVQPTNASAVMGEKVSVSVTAEGDGLTYVWYLKKAGETKFTKTSVTTAIYEVVMSDEYKNAQVYCYVFDKYGNVVKSATASLCDAFVITAQPTDGYAAMGEKVSVKVVVSGNDLTYTWYIQNAGQTKFSKSSVTSSTYSATMSDKAKDRQVYCVVSDPYGNQIQTQTVSLREIVSITAQPTTGYAKMGEKVSVKVVASGDGLTYEWRVKNAGSSKYSSSSITGDTYTVTMSEKVKDRLVFCYVYDQYGNKVKCETVRLRESVSIVTNPETGYAAMGEKVSIKVVASGDGLTYKWRVKNAGSSEYVSSSITGDTYTVTMSDKVKDRLVFCYVYDQYGNRVKTETVRLRETVSVATQSTTKTAKDGATIKVSAKASGDGLTYQWYVKGIKSDKYVASTATNSTYTVEMSSKVSGRSIYCVVTDKYGNVVETQKITLKME